MDGRRRRKRFFLKPIDKVSIRLASKYSGRNPECFRDERRCSLVKGEFHWPSPFNLGEGSILMTKLANRKKDVGGVAAATRIERCAIN